jgi:hypothetical protein
MPLGHAVRPGLVGYRTPAFETQLSVWPVTVLAVDAGLAPAVTSYAAAPPPAVIAIAARRAMGRDRAGPARCRPAPWAPRP